MDKTLFANLKLSDGREAQARELLDDKIHRLGGAAPYLSAANDDLIQEVAADLAEAKRCLARPGRRRCGGCSSQRKARAARVEAPQRRRGARAGRRRGAGRRRRRGPRRRARRGEAAARARAPARKARRARSKTAARELELLNGDGGAAPAAATKPRDAAPPAPRKKQGPRPSSAAPRGSSPSQRRAGADDDDAGELAFDGGVPVDPRLRIPGEERKLEALMAKIDLTKPPAAREAASAAAPLALARAAAERGPEEGRERAPPRRPCAAAPPAGTAGEAVAARADEPAAAAATTEAEEAPAPALKKNRDAVAGEMLRDLEAMKGAAAEAIYVEGIAAGRDAEASEARARAEAKAAEELRRGVPQRGGRRRQAAPKPAPAPGGAGRPGPTLRGIRRRQRRRGLLPPPRRSRRGGRGAEDRDARRAAAEGPVFTPITKFGWDQGDEHSAWVNVVVGLAGVENAAKVTCDVQTDAFDLKVLGLRGANYRLKKTALDDDVVPSASRHVVKSGRVTVKLHKKPRRDGDGKTTYPAWTALTCAGGDRRRRSAARRASTATPGAWPTTSARICTTAATPTSAGRPSRNGTAFSPTARTTR
ncbi:RNA cap guanine-N2 methyltransferase [Aureococcus anophagefferens]|nr:RNA cap guanine-N2 methyltransferase [Aureococcus anophagefferens]